MSTNQVFTLLRGALVLDIVLLESFADEGEEEMPLRATRGQCSGLILYPPAQPLSFLT